VLRSSSFCDHAAQQLAGTLHAGVQMLLHSRMP
jgi:hypothetical protein